MSRVGHLLFPGCVKAPRDIHTQKASKCFSKATQHVITALVLAILVGGGAAAGAFFLTHGSIMYTAIAGGGAAAFVLLVGYVALRCIFGRSKKIALEEKKPTLKKPPKHPSTKTSPSEKKKKKLKEKKRVTSSSDLLGIGGSKKKEKGPSIGIKASKELPFDARDAEYKVEYIFPANNVHTVEILKAIDSKDFTKQMKKAGVVFYDPSNEIPVTFGRLYQGLLNHPATIITGKRELVMSLLAQELDDKWMHSKNKETDVRKLIKYFDSDTILEIAKHVTVPKLAVYLRKHTPKETDLRIARSMHAQIELARQTEEYFKGSTFSFGVALDDGSCFFHSVAQQLTALFGVPITEKMLRVQCADYMEALEKLGETRTNWVEKQCSASFSMLPYAEAKKGGRLSSKEIMAYNRMGESLTPTWGQPVLHGEIIAELYGINLIAFEATPFDEGIDFNDGNGIRYCAVGDPREIKPYAGKGRITLADIGVKGIELDTGKNAYIAGMDGHFFPVWAFVK